MKEDNSEVFNDVIDDRFANIQKYINEYPYIDDETKSNMISLCIQCNDMIFKMANKYFKNA